MYKYVTKFNLTEPVNNFELAYNYLSSNNMLEHFSGDNTGLVSIYWILETDNSGVVEVVSDTKLTESQKLELKEFISGQNSDGLGESFEQQDFALTCTMCWNSSDNCTCTEDDFYYGRDTGEYSDVIGMSSFCYKTDDYSLVEV